jgi:hypothetical protein
MIDNVKRTINYKISIKPIKITPILIRKMKTVINTTIYQKIIIISKNTPKIIRKSWKNNTPTKKITFKISTTKKTIITY